MKRYALTALCAALAIAPVSIAAKQPTPELQALDDALPGNLINDPGRLDWPVMGAGATSKAIKGVTAPGGAALQITSPRKGANLYDISTNAPITAEIKPGQRITVAFYARTIKSETADGLGVVGLRFQQNFAPFGGFGDTRVTIGKEWQLYEATAISDRAIPAGQAIIGFQLAGAKQTIEIGQTIIVEGASSIIAKPTTAISAPTPVMLPQLVGKGTPINDPANLEWDFFGAGTRKIVAAKGMPGDAANQFTVPAIGANPYDTGASVPINEAINEGDILIVAVLARTISADTPDSLGKLGIRVQQNVAPYPGFGEQKLSIGLSWKLYQIKTQARINIPKGQAVIGLHLAGAKQVIEIGRVYVLNGVTP